MMAIINNSGGTWLGGQRKEWPSTISKRHVRTVPGPEDDTLDPIAKLDTTTFLLKGSEWPHAGDFRKHADFWNKVEGLDSTTKRPCACKNGTKLSSGVA